VQSKCQVPESATPLSKGHHQASGTTKTKERQTGQGQSCGEVQIRVELQKISETLNIPQSTIKSIIRKWKEYDTTTNLPREGRSPKLTDQARRALIRESTRRPNITLKELQSSDTPRITIALHRPGLYVRVARRK
jgi:hypothetical protein